MHTEAPFSHALDRHSSDAVAVKHYEWIREALASHGVAVTPYTVALVWNGGMRAVTDSAPRAAVDYATRAANLAAELERPAVAYAR